MVGVLDKKQELRLKQAQFVARVICEKFTSETDFKGKNDLLVLDLVFMRALKFSTENPNSDDLTSDLVLGFGYLIGDLFCANLNFVWSNEKDEYGEELFILNINNQTRIYPFTLVQQKVNTKEIGFIRKIYSMYAEIVY
jgi:hypothetical protein